MTVPFQVNAEAGPSSRPLTPSSAPTRSATKPINHSRPILKVSTHRNATFSPSSPRHRLSSPISAGPTNPRIAADGVESLSPTQAALGRRGLKRRISTPSLRQEITSPTETGAPVQQREADVGPPATRKDPVQSRGRSTSTSVVVPSTLSAASPTIAVPAPSIPIRPSTARLSSTHAAPGLVVIPASPEVSDDESTVPSSASIKAPHAPTRGRTFQAEDHARADEVSAVPPPSQPVPLLESVYNAAETSIRRFAAIVRPNVPKVSVSTSTGGSSGHNHPIAMQRYSSETDSEKGLSFDEGTSSISTASADTPTTRDSLDTDVYPYPHDTDARRGRYWGIWASEEEAQDKHYVREELVGRGDYFSRPSTPPDEDEDAAMKGPYHAKDFEAALLRVHGVPSTLPTPALSAHSLSRGGKKLAGARASSSTGWLHGVLARWASPGTAADPAGRGLRGGQTAKVIRELGWTVGALIGGFVVSLGLAFWLLKSLPITTLRHLPRSTTDVQLLSAEIRSYMASGDAGWWHTIGVLTYVGCWKHAWSVPGAIVLNILVGSILDPLPALLLLTIITATGSLGSYLLSRPLAPLIAVLFPRPLALVRSALAPPANHSAAPRPSSPTLVSSTSGATPAGGLPSNTSVWRRLLVMRATGLVPWSGMNVACGVVGVDWKVFWITTAAGSASWSYTTASIGNILARLAIVASSSTTTSVTASFADAEVDGIGPSLAQVAGEGESLTAMLRDPALIAKLVFLTALSLIPVLLKSRPSAPVAGETSGAVPEQSTLGMPSPPQFGYTDDKTVAREADIVDNIAVPSSPTTHLASALARFTPAPAVFDVLSFGRTVVRTAAGAVVGGFRQVALVGSKLVGA